MVLQQRASRQIVPAGIDFGGRGTTSHAVVTVIALPDGARVWSRPFVLAGAPQSALIMARDQIDMTPIESRDALVAWFAEGVKPKAEFRIGTEHEKFPFTVEGHRPIPYEGRRSIRSLLEGMQHLLGWEPITRGRQHHRHVRRDRRRRDLARAGRAVRTVRRAGRDRAPHLLGADGASCAVAGGGASARHRLPRARHDAGLDARRHPDDAERAATAS